VRGPDEWRRKAVAAPRRARTRVAREERRDDVPYGEFGVLAYDDLADRIQCHACGRWFEKLTSFHLKRHGLTIANYKERYGLNATTALETPRITALRRRQNAETQAHHHLIPAAKGSQPPGGAAGYCGARSTAESTKRRMPSRRVDSGCGAGRTRRCWRSCAPCNARTVAS